jgi:hypothetical protein
MFAQKNKHLRPCIAGLLGSETNCSAALLSSRGNEQVVILFLRAGEESKQRLPPMRHPLRAGRYTAKRPFILSY